MLNIAAASSTVSIVTAVVGAIVAILGALGYQNRRARVSAIRTAFDQVTGSLASDDERQQLAAAVLLRRFFDPTSELGTRNLRGRLRAPYAGEALSVITAVLRGLPSGDLQKVLADGLAYAPTLQDADLQRTNLQGAYLPSRCVGGTLDRADFYRADLSGGSLKGASVAGAIFYQARLRGTVMRDADLRGANFYQADVTGSHFAGARLEGASFAETYGVPAELHQFLDGDGCYATSDPAPEPALGASGPPAVFFSLPSVRTPSQEGRCDRLATLLRDRGLAIERLRRAEYPPSNALSEIYRRIAGCSGVVVFGMSAGGAPAAGSSPGATPWVHLEAGMAYGCSLPVLIVREPGVNAGAFDDAVAGYSTYMLDVTDEWEDQTVMTAIGPWLAEVTDLVAP